MKNFIGLKMRIFVNKIECGVINQDGIFNIDDKDFKQCFKFVIDKRLKNIKVNKEKQLSKEILDFLNNFKNKFSEKALNDSIEEIASEIYKKKEYFLSNNIKMILDCLFDKVCQMMEHYYKK